MPRFVFFLWVASLSPFACVATSSGGDGDSDADGDADVLPDGDADVDSDADADAPCDDGETRDCWSGPAAALDVGACTSGTATCVGGAWGACVGEVLPSDETCNEVDDDCDAEVDEEGDAVVCYADADRDTYGDEATARAACACVPGETQSEVGFDCDDTNADVHPGGESWWYWPFVDADGNDSWDYDCNGFVSKETLTEDGCSDQNPCGPERVWFGVDGIPDCGEWATAITCASCDTGEWIQGCR